VRFRFFPPFLSSLLTLPSLSSQFKKPAREKEAL
jgi:hypothetical protein